MAASHTTMTSDDFRRLFASVHVYDPGINDGIVRFELVPPDGKQRCVSGLSLRLNRHGSTDDVIVVVGDSGPEAHQQMLDLITQDVVTI